MRKLLILLLLVFPAAAHAVCPATPTNCPSPTFFNVTIAGTLTSAQGLVTGNGTANQLAFFPGSGSVISGVATGNNGVLITNAFGSPMISTTLPGGLAMGTPISLNLTNATVVPAARLSGIVPAASGGAGTINGALAANGAGAVSRAACAGLSDSGTACTVNTGTTGAVVPLTNGNNAWTGGNAVSPLALTFGATVTPNAALSNNFTLTATGSFTLANPTNLVAGEALNFWITQDATGSRVVTYGSKYQAAGSVTTLALSTAANAKDLVSCMADTTATMTCAIQAGISH
ncbi:MAG TPA: hypothetical protein VIO57_10310 [Chloroflexota bacterium]